MSALTIHQRIVAVKTELTGVEKGSRNTHFNYAYAGHEAINYAMRPLFLKHGIVQTIHCRELVLNQHAVMCMVGVRWSSADDASSFVEGDVPALMPSSSKGFTPQMAASLISYGCKGFALKVLMLTDKNEPDAGSWQPEPEAPKADSSKLAAADAMLLRFDQLNSMAELKAFEATTKTRWRSGEFDGAPALRERYMTARQETVDRIKGAAQ